MYAKRGWSFQSTIDFSSVRTDVWQPIYTIILRLQNTIMSFFHLVDIQWRTYILNLSCIFDYVLLLLGISGLSRCRFVHGMPTLTLVKMGVVSKQLSIQTFKFTLGQLLACLSLCVYGMRFIVKLLCQSSQLGTIFLQVEWCCFVSPAFPPGL